MSAQTRSIETGVDRLVQFLQAKGKTELKKAADELKLPAEVVQSWVDFLVEEHVIGIEYKLTTPFIFLQTEKTEANNKPSLTGIKKSFADKVKTGSMSDNKTEYLWKNYVMSEIESLRPFFYEEASKRDLNNIDSLWEEYKKEAV